MAYQVYVVKPCLSQKTFSSLEKQLVSTIAPLYYSFLKTLGDYEFGLEEEDEKVKEAADISRIL